MAIPPGPRYLFSLLPFFLGPPAVVYAGLRLADTCLGLVVPTWVTVAAVVLARPFLSIFQRYYTRYKDRKAAAANYASIVPHVEEKRPNFGGLSIMSALVKDLKTGYPGDMTLTWMEKYGNVFQLRLISDNRIVTFEPDHIKAILATQFDAFDKGPILYKQFHSLLGTGVFNSDGDMWKFHRSMTRPFFSKERITHFDIFEDLVSRFTLDSATEFLFGHDVQSLSAGIPYPPAYAHLDTETFKKHPSNEFVDAFLRSQNQTAVRTRLGPTWPLAEFWGDKIKADREVLDRFSNPILVEALRKKDLEKKDAGADGDYGDSLLSHLVHHTQDTNVLKDELVNLLVAGRDTTGCTLTYAFYMLSEHPEVVERLRQEILEKVGPTNRPTYDNLREMKYLRAFINEVLRLYPPVPFDSRMSSKATVWTSKVPGSKSYYIPANTRVLYGVFNMHRRTDLWGPDALEFDPDRFLDERLHKYLTPNPYIFCPFNAGPRICLGQQFAYHESSFFIVRLLQQFTNFRLAPDVQPPESKPPASWAETNRPKAREKIMPGTHLTMYVKGGLWVRMDPLKSEIDVV
ncbi:hypothetical protein NLJ89_g3244 [Agrocybe chaxingu]|uniref:Cytochrome P450 monooxygenase pc-3 n=1 Tax=Agrocybe chaxingu TaxID=84603 RepID=A0A9W8K529_9AGAR|nr:hypothetical protein NLJ89_g3244 [Agrocybe chaxingu]